jgi:hypothetical protein
LWREGILVGTEDEGILPPMWGTLAMFWYPYIVELVIL